MKPHKPLKKPIRKQRRKAKRDAYELPPNAVEYCPIEVIAAWAERLAELDRVERRRMEEGKK